MWLPGFRSFDWGFAVLLILLYYLLWSLNYVHLSDKCCSFHFSRGLMDFFSTPGEELSCFPFSCHPEFMFENQSLESAVKSTPSRCSPPWRIQDVEVRNADAVVVCCGLLVSLWQQHDSMQGRALSVDFWKWVFLKSPHKTSAGTYFMSHVGVLFTRLSRTSVIEFKIIRSPELRCGGWGLAGLSFHSDRPMAAFRAAWKQCSGQHLWGATWLDWERARERTACFPAPVCFGGGEALEGRGWADICIQRRNILYTPSSSPLTIWCWIFSVEYDARPQFSAGIWPLRSRVWPQLFQTNAPCTLSHGAVLRQLATSGFSEVLKQGRSGQTKPVQIYGDAINLPRVQITLLVQVAHPTDSVSPT